MEITIYNLKKEPTIIITDEYDTIMFILIKLSELTSIDIDNSRLIYNGKKLEPTQTIGYYGIKNGDHLVLVNK